MFDNLGQNPVLWFSSGLESTLILSMLIEQEIAVDILQMRDNWTQEQLSYADSLLNEWGLEATSHAPISISLIGQGDQITSVWEYDVGGATLPMLRDVVDGKQCLADLTAKRSAKPLKNWDVHIIGSRLDDTHYARPQMIPSERWAVGNVTFYAPLAHWTREQVIEESAKRGLRTVKDVDEGDLYTCHECIKGTGQVWCPKDQKMIDSIVWDREGNLDLWRKSYGISADSHNDPSGF